MACVKICLQKLCTKYNRFIEQIQFWAKYLYNQTQIVYIGCIVFVVILDRFDVVDADMLICCI